MAVQSPGDPAVGAEPPCLEGAPGRGAERSVGDSATCDSCRTVPAGEAQRKSSRQGDGAQNRERPSKIVRRADRQSKMGACARQRAHSTLQRRVEGSRELASSAEGKAAGKPMAIKTQREIHAKPSGQRRREAHRRGAHCQVARTGTLKVHTGRPGRPGAATSDL